MPSKSLRLPKSRAPWTSRVVTVASVVFVISGTLDAQSAVPMTSSASSASPDPFVRYTTPGQCQQAAIRLQQSYWRDKRPDTVRYAPATDSVPAPVVRAVRACASRFTIPTVPVSELRNLAQLYLWTGQDTLALQAIDRLMQTDRNRSARDRGWMLSLWIDAALTARPVRYTVVRTFLAQLDALGAPAATWRLFAHTQCSEYAFSVNDPATAESEGRAALAASRQMSTDDRMDWVSQIIKTYVETAQPIARARGGAAALAFLDTMITDVTPLRPAGTVDRRRLVGDLTNRRMRFTPLGTSAWPSVRADAWYSAPGDTVHPKPGRLSLLIFVYGADYPMIATVRRLSAAYGAQGLDVVFLTSTVGYFRTLLMPSPVVEADSLGSYLRTYLHLPGAVAVETTSFSHLDDGRRRDGETQNQKAYGHVGGAILIDRRGVARWIGDVNPYTEAVWNSVIQGAL